jgi:hypothetical protein
MEVDSADQVLGLLESGNAVRHQVKALGHDKSMKMTMLCSLVVDTLVCRLLMPSSFSVFNLIASPFSHRSLISHMIPSGATFIAPAMAHKSTQRNKTTYLPPPISISL